MSKNYVMTAAKRDRVGKGIARALRREGRIPAVIYGDKKEPIKISLGANDANVEYNRAHMFTTLCDLDVEGEKHLVLARDVQLNPVTDIVEHIDFLRVSAKTKIAVDVPVHFINEEKSPGLDQKGVLNVVRYTVELVCGATNIPEQIEVNLEGKEQGDAVHISDAILPEGTKPVIDDRDFTIATIVAPRKVEEVEAAESEEAAGGEEAAEGGEDAPAEEKSE
ncbi:MAG: 50S ribosomal protein L25/general stress protein Ctc [Rhodospirillales bacterium]|nr:50S ribosomal protein L25/general stress protein Ctc [Alphaproteobacteria bacterium]MCB9981351.1 50S ribosomal protein L25/general stress protein Ctc [Rhodospirillales bacterium]